MVDMNAYMTARYHRRRAQAVGLLGGVCIDCGARDALEFDHDDASTKSFDLAKAFASMRWDRIEPELAKCVLRCTPCHRRKTCTSGERVTVEHGGGASGKRNCRCDPCRDRKREYMQRYNAHRAVRSSRTGGTDA